MKKGSQNKIQKMVTHGFTAHEVSDRIPTYRGSGRQVEYQRHLPPIRNPRDIDLGVLVDLIQEYAPSNQVALISSHTFELNGTDVRIDPVKGQVVFAKISALYSDLRSLLDLLKFEGQFYCTKNNGFNIEKKYKARCLKH